jgi:Periplasmic copper-binding protein (NosD)
MTRSRRTLARASRMLVRCGLVAAGVMLPAGAATAHEHSSQLFVSPSGSAGAADRSCDTARYSTIQSAVDAAPEWSTVVVCGGTYKEDVIVSSPLKLKGHHAVIEGSSSANGHCDQLGPGGPSSAPCLAGITIKSSHVEVEGFTVQGAIGEGILATGSLRGGPISEVTIEENRVVGNNTGGIPPSSTSPYPECAAQGQIPGDCGEGIHLMGVGDSSVRDNYVSGNEGGVLLTDEFGPTHDNVVERNVVTKNAFDCGVTAPGHNPFALDSHGNRQPNMAGVYDNVIRRNWITDNGLRGEGAGVLFANAGPGTGSYDNLVEDNYIAGNELSGVTMHAHTLGPGQFEDLNGNRIIHNVIGENNVGGPAGPGDPLDGAVTDPSTTGILVFSGTVPVDVTIARNRIFDDHFGVWLGVGSGVTAKIHRNTFHDVDVSVFTHP